MNTIVTKRLHLRESLGDVNALHKQVEWLNDKHIMRYSEQRHRSHHVDFQKVFISMMGPPNHFREIYLDDEIIGTITARVDVHNSVADVGILIGEHQGNGYGTEAWRAFCDTLLVTGIRKIEAGMMGCNFGMINICRRTEMHEEGRRADHFHVGGELADLVQFARFG